MLNLQALSAPMALAEGAQSGRLRAFANSATGVA